MEMNKLLISSDLTVQKPEQHLDKLRRIVYIREFRRNGYAQWDCPDCGETNLLLRANELQIGQTQWCRKCGQSYTRTVGMHDNETEIIQRDVADQIFDNFKLNEENK